MEEQRRERDGHAEEKQKAETASFSSVTVLNTVHQEMCSTEHVQSKIIKCDVQIKLARVAG